MAISVFAMRPSPRPGGTSFTRWRPFLTGVLVGLCLLVAVGAAIA